MARLSQRRGDLLFHVRLTPRGGRDAVEGWIRDASGAEHLKVRVSSPPENGKANAALIALLSKTFDIAKSRLNIVTGDTARFKTIAVSSAMPGERARLNTFGEQA
ncbi:MAG: DUF167 domain-containing protein [Alphaproteobacteria bacterium]|nr:DUF167 domain-containing protein [Alphaproteobacteria bacterium]MBV9418877.1 DUF167 domain-containing protein [Alphaproteobacteria bacterium]MBV9540380.1 DUF167 domain-containing protein [Alphaproteobacteria bacterium]MBV9903365.1 DUF167 domain-containing protein [Alphaproteobacteria bacterium]